MKVKADATDRICCIQRDWGKVVLTIPLEGLDQFRFRVQRPHARRIRLRMFHNRIYGHPKLEVPIPGEVLSRSLRCQEDKAGYQQSKFSQNNHGFPPGVLAYSG